MKTRLIGITLIAASTLTAVTINFTPAGGRIQGAPGQTVGWGFQLTNDTPYFALLTGSEFTPPAATGSYTDLISLPSNFYDVAPHSNLVQAFSFGLSGAPGVTTNSGLGLFAIDPEAAGGSVDAGMITVSYDLYSADPNNPDFDPGASAISFGNTVSGPATVTVTPEPGTGWVAGLVLALFGIGRRYLPANTRPIRRSAVWEEARPRRWA